MSWTLCLLTRLFRLYAQSDEEMLYLMENGMFELSQLRKFAEIPRSSTDVVYSHCVASVTILELIRSPNKHTSNVDIFRVLSIVNNYADDQTFIEILRAFCRNGNSRIFECSNLVVRRTVKLLDVDEWIPTKKALLPSLEKRSAACDGWHARLDADRDGITNPRLRVSVAQMLSSDYVSREDLYEIDRRNTALRQLREIARDFALERSCAIFMCWDSKMIVRVLVSFAVLLGLGKNRDMTDLIEVCAESNLIFLDCSEYRKTDFSSSARVLLREHGHGLFLAHFFCDKQKKCAMCMDSPCIHGDLSCEVRHKCSICSCACLDFARHDALINVQHIRTHPYMKIRF